MLLAMKQDLIARWHNRNVKKKRGPQITVPTGVSPHVRLVFTEMQRQAVTYDEVEAGSGVLRTTLKAWRHKNRPTLTSIEAVLGYLGWDFVPIPRERALPPELVDELRPIADRFGLSMAAATEALIALVALVHERAAATRQPEPEKLNDARRAA